MGTEQNQNSQYQSIFTACIFLLAFLLCLLPNRYLAGATAIVLIIGISIQAIRKSSYLVTPLTLSLILFMGSASLNVWSAYNFQQAITKLLILFVAMLLSFYLFSIGKESKNISSYLAIGSVVFAIASVAIPLIGIERGELLTPNRLAGLIAILTPFLLHTLITSESKTMKMLTSGSLIMISIALIMSGSRGGIVALLIGISLWWLLAGKHFIKPKYRTSAVGITLLSILSIGIIGLLTVSQLSKTALIRIPGSGSRLTLYSNLQQLIPDYWLLGGGLNSFSGHYSQYILSIPHLRFTYGHNLYFDLILEQGIIGIVSFCFLILTSIVVLLNHLTHDNSVENNGSQKVDIHFSGAILASMTTLILHGFIDNAIYSNAGSTMLFVAPALAFTYPNFQKPNKLIRAISLITAVFALILAIIFSDRVISAWYSNLGAIEMAKVQLEEWPTGEWSDGGAADSLEIMIPRFDHALEVNQNNAPAHYRLGLIEMENHNFLKAQEHLNQAYELAPTHIGIKKNLGYALLWSGANEEAGRYLGEVEGIQNELDAYTWWWQTLNRPELSEAAQTMRQSNLLISP